MISRIIKVISQKPHAIIIYNYMYHPGKLGGGGEKGWVRWPISATAKLTFPRQNLLFHSKTYFITAKLTFSQQNLLFHGKTYFSTAKLTFSRQNLLFHGKTYFSTAKLTFSRQNLLFHGKTYFSMAKLTFSRQNLLPASSLSVSTAPRH